MTTNKPVSERVIDLIADELPARREEVVPGAHFVNDLNMDSLDFIELVMAAEEAFDISIDDDEAEQLDTVGDAIAFIERALSPKKGAVCN